MLSSLHNDACYVRQETEDVAKRYAYQMDPMQYHRPALAAPQGAGVFVDRAGNGQSQVDLESLLRNQSFVDSTCSSNRAQADACLLPFAQAQQLQATQLDMVPRIQYHSRSCDPMSGLSINRFDPVLYKGMAFKYGYAAIPTNTTWELKNALERSRNTY